MNLVLLDDYQMARMKELIRVNTPVLICPKDPETAGEWEALVHSCGGIALIPPDGYTWKSLFRLAFSRRASVVIGEPRIVLGLYKLVRAYGVALKIKTAVLLCGKRDEWMFEDIRHGLDCYVFPICVEQESMDDDVAGLEQELLSWTSILDCQIAKGESGLELKVVHFPGERMPMLPSCAKLQKTAWQQNEDVPFFLNFRLNNG